MNKSLVNKGGVMLHAFARFSLLSSQSLIQGLCVSNEHVFYPASKDT